MTTERDLKNRVLLFFVIMGLTLIDLKVLDMNKQPTVSITKRIRLSTGHRLYNAEFSEDENRKVFDKCYDFHGHNYWLECTVKGKIDAKTGMVIDLRLKVQQSCFVQLLKKN